MLAISDFNDIGPTLCKSGVYISQYQDYKFSLYVTSGLNGEENLVNQIERIEEAALGLIPADIEAKVQAVGFRIILKASFEAVAHCYATISKRVLSLQFLHVVETARKSGIGSYLCQKVIEHAKQCHADKIEVSTFEFQAPQFYEKFGFERIHEVVYGIEEYKRISLEKTIDPKDSFIQNPELPSDFQLESFSTEYADFSGIYKENAKELKKICDAAIMGLLEFNNQYLESKDGNARDSKTFALEIKENDSNETYYALTGWIVAGSATCPSFHLDTLGLHQKFQPNTHITTLVSKILSEMCLAYKIKTIVFSDPGIRAHLKELTPPLPENIIWAEYR